MPPIVVVLISFAIALYSLWHHRFILEWIIAICLFSTCLNVLFMNSDTFPLYLSLASSILFALTAWGSLLLQSPFTIVYAKKRVAPHLYDNPIFLKINTMMTTVFGILFSLDIIVKTLKLMKPTLCNYSIISYGFLIATMMLVAWFPKWYYKRSVANENSCR